MVRLFATHVVYHSPGQQRAHLDFVSVKSTLVARTPPSAIGPSATTNPRTTRTPQTPRRRQQPRTHGMTAASPRDARATAPAPAQDKSRPRLHALHQRPTQPRWQKLTDVSCRHRPIRNECGIYGTNAVFLTESSLRTHLRTANIGAYLPFSSIGALNKGLAPPLEHPPHRAAYARNA